MPTEPTSESNPSENGQADTKFARLRAIRGGNRSVVSKLQAEVAVFIESRSSSYAEPNVLSRLESISDSLTTKKEYLRQLHEQIVGLCAIEELEKEIEESSDWETRINETLGKIRNVKQGRYRAAPTRTTTSSQASTAPVTSTPSTDGTSSNQQQQTSEQGPSNSDLNLSSQSHTSSGSLGVKLPKISLPRFNGEVTKISNILAKF